MILFTFAGNNTLENESSDVAPTVPVVTWIQTICRETCEQAIQACFPHNPLYASFIDCNFYPKEADSNKCLQFNVTCDLPKEVGNARTKNEDIRYSYRNGSRIEASSSVLYECNKGYIMDGDATVKCQYSGFWSPQPKCDLSLLIILLPPLSILLTVIILSIVICMRKRRASHGKMLSVESPHFTFRQREYDAFISYNSEGPDEDFIRNQLYPKLELENDPPLKIFFHKRDFKAGTLINVNIANAISKSNAGIVILSQEYLDSSWCIEEFDWFLEERRKDPSFLIYAIIMQNLKTLNKCPVQLAKFINENTGLEKDDLELWKKLSKLLLDLRGPENDEPKEETTEL